MQDQSTGIIELPQQASPMSDFFGTLLAFFLAVLVIGVVGAMALHGQWLVTHGRGGGIAWLSGAFALVGTLASKAVRTVVLACLASPIETLRSWFATGYVLDPATRLLVVTEQRWLGFSGERRRSIPFADIRKVTCDSVDDEEEGWCQDIDLGLADGTSIKVYRTTFANPARLAEGKALAARLEDLIGIPKGT